MAYVSHIENLYRYQDILLFKEAWALEKIHGTNAFVRYSSDKGLQFGSGGEKHERFVKLFNQEELLQKFVNGGFPLDKTVTIYGEAYGGSQQGMSETYGNSLKFIAFDVQVGDCWLDVLKAEKVCKDYNIEFVHYVKVSTDLKELDIQRDAPSMQAVRNGVSRLLSKEETISSGYVALPNHMLCGGYVVDPKKREGIVLRPLIELTRNNGERVICKHKTAQFGETKTERPVVDPSKLIILTEANAVADEWVTKNRLDHVLDKIPNHDITMMGKIIATMIEDVYREGKGEFVESDAVKKAISKKTALLYKSMLESNIGK